MAGSSKYRRTGFTLLELLVVIAIVAIATAGVGLALRDTSAAALEREAQRLAALFESARAQSRASGIAVTWHTTPDGFRFDGLPADALPQRWVLSGTAVRGTNTVRLGPEPIIGAQTVELTVAALTSELKTVGSQPPELQVVRVATDGLRPFAVKTPGQP
jgi:general secretion pathway protein H